MTKNSTTTHDEEVTPLATNTASSSINTEEKTTFATSSSSQSPASQSDQSCTGDKNLFVRKPSNKTKARSVRFKKSAATSSLKVKSSQEGQKNSGNKNTEDLHEQFEAYRRFFRLRSICPMDKNRASAHRRRLYSTWGFSNDFTSVGNLAQTHTRGDELNKSFLNELTAHASNNSNSLHSQRKSSKTTLPPTSANNQHRSNIVHVLIDPEDSARLPPSLSTSSHSPNYSVPFETALLQRTPRSRRRKMSEMLMNNVRERSSMRSNYAARSNTYGAEEVHNVTFSDNASDFHPPTNRTLKRDRDSDFAFERKGRQYASCRDYYDWTSPRSTYYPNMGPIHLAPVDLNQYRNVFPYTTLYRRDYYQSTPGTLPHQKQYYRAHGSRENLSNKPTTSANGTLPRPLKIYEIYSDETRSEAPSTVPQVVYVPARSRLIPQPPCPPNYPMGYYNPAVYVPSATQSLTPTVEQKALGALSQSRYRRCLLGWLIGIIAAIVVALSLALFIQVNRDGETAHTRILDQRNYATESSLLASDTSPIGVPVRTPTPPFLPGPRREPTRLRPLASPAQNGPVWTRLVGFNWHSTTASTSTSSYIETANSRTTPSADIDHFRFPGAGSIEEVELQLNNGKP